MMAGGSSRIGGGVGWVQRWLVNARWQSGSRISQYIGTDSDESCAEMRSSSYEESISCWVRV